MRKKSRLNDATDRLRFLTDFAATPLPNQCLIAAANNLQKLNSHRKHKTCRVVFGYCVKLSLFLVVTF